MLLKVKKTKQASRTGFTTIIIVNTIQLLYISSVFSGLTRCSHSFKMNKYDMSVCFQFTFFLVILCISFQISVQLPRRSCQFQTETFISLQLNSVSCWWWMVGIFLPSSQTMGPLHSSWYKTFKGEVRLIDHKMFIFQSFYMEITFGRNWFLW